MSEIKLTSSTSGRKTWINNIKVKERKAFIISMRLMGFTTSTIQQQVINMSWIKEWGRVTLRTIQLTISEHCKRYPLDKIQAYQLDYTMREAEFAKQEHLIEKANIYAMSKPKEAWRPNEYIYILRSISQMRDKLIENRNWNASKTSNRKSKGLD